MVAALLSETKITLADAARMFPGVNHASVWRWTLKGSKGANGRVVRLEAFRAGARWYTSTEAVTRFVEALSALPGDTSEPAPAPRGPNARRKASDRAAAVLDRAGI